MQARQAGPALACGERMRRLVLEKRPGAFRRALCEDLPAQVEPMIAYQKLGA